VMRMYGKDNDLDDLLEFLLEQFTLEEILEINDLTEREVLLILFREGLLVEPERVFKPGD
jgi:hypothetical protein